MNTFKVIFTGLCLFLSIAISAHTLPFQYPYIQNESKDAVQLSISCSTDNLPDGNSQDELVTANTDLFCNFEWLVIQDEWGVHVIDDGNNDCLIFINATDINTIDVEYYGDCNP